MQRGIPVRLLNIIAFVSMASVGLAQGQQVADSNFVVSVDVPAYAAGTGPVVAVDAGHDNFHTLDGRYAIFGKILEADGYRTISLTNSFTTAALEDIDILVIANAGTDGDAPWHLPTPSAFTTREIATVAEWVRAGGALFIIADHMPAAGATASLAAAFGVQFTNGYTLSRRQSNLPGDAFTRAEGLLHDHPITRGRPVDEPVDSVITFTGQAFQASMPVDTLLHFGPEAITFLPVEAGIGFDDRTPRVASGGWLHAATLRVGEGRIAMFGEAAMFSAQLAGSDRRPMGLNHPRAHQNQQLLLNTVRWLSGLLDNAEGR